MPLIFRETPPLDLLNQFIQCVGLKDIYDFTMFSKKDIQLEKFEELLPLLEPYYIPCKAKDYLYKLSFTKNNAMTILRQILKIHGIELKYSEKSIHGVKTVLYQLITPIINQINPDITIAFE